MIPGDDVPPPATAWDGWVGVVVLVVLAWWANLLRGSV